MILTARRHALLVAIGNGTTTIPRLRKAIGLSSTSAVVHHLVVLQRDGWIIPTRWGTQATLRLAPAVGLFRDGHIARLVPIQRCGRCDLTLPADHHCETDLHTSMDWSRS